MVLHNGRINILTAVIVLNRVVMFKNKIYLRLTVSLSKGLREFLLLYGNRIFFRDGLDYFFQRLRGLRNCKTKNPSQPHLTPYPQKIKWSEHYAHCICFEVPVNKNTHT